MPNIKIDGKEYDTEKLSEDANAQLTSLQFVTGEITRLQSQLAVLQTARNAYSQALQKSLPED